MIELLAVPAWNSPPATLDAWADALRAQSVDVTIDRDPPGAWLEVGSHRLRGYVLSQGTKVEAVNFELSDSDPEPAARLVAAAAAVLGWEVYADEDGETNDD